MRAAWSAAWHDTSPVPRLVRGVSLLPVDAIDEEIRSSVAEPRDEESATPTLVVEPRTEASPTLVMDDTGE